MLQFRPTKIHSHISVRKTSKQPPQNMKSKSWADVTEIALGVHVCISPFIISVRQITEDSWEVFHIQGISLLH